MRRHTFVSSIATLSTHGRDRNLADFFAHTLVPRYHACRMSEMVDRIRAATGWPDVREERRTIRWLGRKYHDRMIELVPSNPASPEVYFVFSDDYEMLQQFGMGEWHGHPEVDAAIELAADLVAGRKCVLERWTHRGKYAGSGLVGSTDVAPAFDRSDGTHVLRRVFFNRAAEEWKGETVSKRESENA
jgi:hypothetical protein